MKIAEYLKLTKQAETIDFNGNSSALPSGSPLDFTIKNDTGTLTPFVSSSSTPLNPQDNQSSGSDYKGDDNRFYDLDEIEKRTREAETEQNKPKDKLQISSQQVEYPTAYTESYFPRQLATNQTGVRPEAGALFLLPFGLGTERFSPKNIKDWWKNFNEQEPFQWGTEDETSSTDPKAQKAEFIREPFKMNPIKNPAEGRSWWKYFTDYGNRKAWGDWWNYEVQKNWTLNRNVKENLNEPFRMVNAFKRPVTPLDFGVFRGAIGKAFPILIPLSEAKRSIEQNASDRARMAGINPEEDRLGYLRFYYPELFKELYRSSTNMLTEGISFANPVAPVTMTGELLGLPLRAMGYKGRIVPSFYHPHYDMNRKRSDIEWENSWNPELIHPDLIKQNVERYGNANYWIDNAAAYGDPIAQTAGWLVDKAYDYTPGGWIVRAKTGKPHLFGNKSTYEHIMDEVGNLRDKTTKYDVDETGTKTVDWQDMVNNSGWYDLNGGRPEFRNMPREKRIEQIQPMIIAAIKNGYTKKQIDQAVDLYIKSPGDPDTEAGSLAYKEGNLLQLMAMAPSEIYGSMAFLNTATNPEDINGIPRYIKRFIPGTGPFSPGGSVVEENPKWTEAKKSLERRIADQQTLFRRFPVFATLQGRDSQLTADEEELLNNEDGLAEVLKADSHNIQDYFENHPFELPDSLIHASEKDIAELKDAFKAAYELRYIANLPVKEKYKYLIEHPRKLATFLSTYYTNPESVQRIKDFLTPELLRQKEQDAVSNIAATQQALILPVLLRARQQAAEAQRRNSGM